MLIASSKLRSPSLTISWKVTAKRKLLVFLAFHFLALCLKLCLTNDLNNAPQTFHENLVLTVVFPSKFKLREFREEFEEMLFSILSMLVCTDYAYPIHDVFHIFSRLGFSQVCLNSTNPTWQSIGSRSSGSFARVSFQLFRGDPCQAPFFNFKISKFILASVSGSACFVITLTGSYVRKPQLVYGDQKNWFILLIAVFRAN